MAVHRIPTRSLERLPRGESERVRRLTRDDWPLVQAVLRRAPRRRSRAGWIATTGGGACWPTRSFVDQTFVYGVDGDDGLAGYVVFTPGRPVRGAGATASWSRSWSRVEPGAAVTLWRLLGGHGMQVESITVQRGPVDELLLVLPGAGRRARCATTGGCTDSSTCPARSRRVASRPTSRRRSTSSSPTGSRRGTRAAGCCGSRAGGASCVPGGTGELQLTINGFSALATGWASATALTGAGAAAPRDRRPTAPRSTRSSPAPPPRWSTTSSPPTRFGVAAATGAVRLTPKREVCGQGRLRWARSTARRAVSRLRSARVELGGDRGVGGVAVAVARRRRPAR